MDDRCQCSGYGKFCFESLAIGLLYIYNCYIVNVASMCTQLCKALSLFHCMYFAYCALYKWLLPLLSSCCLEFILYSPINTITGFLVSFITCVGQSTGTGTGTQRWLDWPAGHCGSCSLVLADYINIALGHAKVELNDRGSHNSITVKGVYLQMKKNQFQSQK